MRRCWRFAPRRCLAKGDSAGARAALEQAVAIAPSAIGLLMTLARLEEADRSYDAAIARYQRILELQPSNVIALNNLAYALAVYRNAPAEGTAAREAGRGTGASEWQRARHPRVDRAPIGE